MKDVNLVLTIPHGSLVATSLGIDGLARHLSPGSGKFFQSRNILVDLALEGDTPQFNFLNEGGWRDADGDTRVAIKAVVSGKRTKTALSNNAFSATPLSAYEQCYLMKTGGQVLELKPLEKVASLKASPCHENMSPADIAAAAGQPATPQRTPRFYALFAPIEILVLSNLTPAEYAWYATRRPGKVCRQVCFAEISGVEHGAAAASRYEDAYAELRDNPNKKTKTIAIEDVINQVPFESWVGFAQRSAGGLYFGDKDSLYISRVPESIPFVWEKAD